MADFLGKIKGIFAVGDYEDEELEDEVDVDEIPPAPARQNPVRANNVTNFDQYSARRPVSQAHAGSRFMNNSAQVEVVIASPTNLEEAGVICTDLRAKKATVVNLENVEYESAQRISDFLSGAAYALEGKIQLISDRIFIIGPVNVDITGEFKDELSASGIKLPKSIWR